MEQNDNPDFDGIAVETMQDVASSVTMVQHKWGAKVTDVSATRAAKEAKSASGDAGEFKKNLLNGSKAGMSKVTTAMSKAYRAHIAMTLPWANGQRIIANSMLLDYMKEMNAQTVVLNAAKADWMTTLPREIETAIQRNGAMGDAAEYPTPDQIIAAFSFEFDFSPIPDSRGFAGLPDGFRDRFADIYESKARACAAAAQQDGVERLTTAVASFADVLKGDKPRIYDTTLAQLKLLHSVASSFNITGDVAVQKALDELQSNFLCYTKDQLTGNIHNMQKAADSADTALKCLRPVVTTPETVPVEAPEQSEGLHQTGTSEQDGMEPTAPVSQSSEAPAEDDNTMSQSEQDEMLDPELAALLRG